MALLSARKIKIKSGEELTIRNFQPDDTGSFQDFVKDVSVETTHTLKYSGMSVTSADELRTLWTQTEVHPINLQLGVFQNRTVVANLRLFQRNENHSWIQHIASFGMAVRKDFWGQSIGSLLLSTMLEHSRSSGLLRIEAEVRCENEAGIHLYLKHGFEIEGTRRKAARIHNQFVDEYYIAKFLS